MQKTKQQTLILVDAHVHLYDCFDVPTVLSSAHENFRLAARHHDHHASFMGVLMLAESSGYDWFMRLTDYAESRRTLAGSDHGRWQFLSAIGPGALLARSTDGRELILMAGRQIVTGEKLEVLALATLSRFQDGLPLRETIDAIREEDALAVLPWGFGKWLGRRGKKIKALLRGVERPTLYLGDNGGRPVLWTRPRIFKDADRRDIKILPGSDTLPLPQESVRCGSFGFLMKGTLSLQEPQADIKRLIADKNSEIQPYGQLERPLRFLRNQVRLRLQ